MIIFTSEFCPKLRHALGLHFAPPAQRPHGSVPRKATPGRAMLEAAPLAGEPFFILAKINTQAIHTSILSHVELNPYKERDRMVLERSVLTFQILTVSTGSHLYTIRPHGISITLLPALQECPETGGGGGGLVLEPSNQPTHIGMLTRGYLGGAAGEFSKGTSETTGWSPVPSSANMALGTHSRSSCVH